MFKLSRNYRLASVVLRRVFIEDYSSGLKCRYSETSGDGKDKKNKSEEKKDELDQKLDIVERPCENTHGSGVLGQKQTAHEKEYFYKEEQDQIRELKKRLKEQGSLKPDKDKKK